MITAGSEYEPDPKMDVVTLLEPNGVPAAVHPTSRGLLPAGYRHRAGETIAQWDTPIPPPEANQILAKMSTFKEANVYKVGESYLGKDVWAMDLMPPIEASHWSQAKQTTAEADHRLLGAAARERSVFDEPRAETRRTAADRSELPREAE